MKSEQSKVADQVPAGLAPIMQDSNFRTLGLHGEQERLLVSLIVTHGIVTKSTWGASTVFSSEELANAMWTLTRRRLVVARPLSVGTTYFMLSKSAASKLGLPPLWAKALEGDGKLRAFARLLFFTQYYPDAARISNEDVATAIGQCVGGLPQGFFRRQGVPDWLGFLRIDGHMTGVPTRSARSLRDDVLRMVAFDTVKSKLKQANFEWFWITARQSRADAVMALFRAFDVRCAPVTVVVMPELVALIPTKERTV